MKFIKNEAGQDVCKECIYYVPENQTCQLKKCSGWGFGYVTWSDRKFCKAGRKKEEPDG